MRRDERLAYTVAEAAPLLGMSEWSVRRAVDRGDIPVLPFAGRRVLIPAEALRRAVDAAATRRPELHPCRCGRPTVAELCAECEQAVSA